MAERHFPILLKAKPTGRKKSRGENLLPGKPGGKAPALIFRQHSW